MKDDREIDNYYSLWHHSICIVAGANMVSKIEIEQAICDLNKIIGTGYYDEEGDALLKYIKEYLSKKI